MTFDQTLFRTARKRTCEALGLTLVLAAYVLIAAAGTPPYGYKPALDTSVGRRVFADLAAYYAALEAEKQDPNVVPYREMVQRLSSSEAAKRKEAGEYLYALCVQTEADDRSGRSPRPRGMKLGGGPNDYGAELRGWAAAEISQATFYGNGKEAFETTRWLYQCDTWPEHRENGVKALTRIRTPEADKAFVEIIEKTEGHFEILSMALQQVAERKLSEAKDKIRPLCRHYHAGVRETALAAASQLGLKDVGRYDPRTDLGPRIEPWLRTVLTVLPDKVPADAKWRRFTIPATLCDDVHAEGRKDVEVCVWLVGEDREAYRVIDWYGRPRTWSREKVQVRPDSLREFTDRVIRIREKFNGSQDNSEKQQLQESVGIRCFMMSSDSLWRGSIPEVLVAAWSIERGDRETCVRLMIPLLKDVSDEKLFLDHFCDEIAVEIDQRMLTAFTSRDYHEAERLAKILAGPFFDGFVHQDRAKGLAATLPQRAEDFQSLALVSPAVWQAEKNHYSRQQQTEYLAKRLRLIRAVQYSNPGGVAYSDAQYLSKNNVQGGKPQADAPFLPEGEEAINPFCELLRMNLTGAEMLPLVPYLESPDYILAYDLYRFLPQGPCNLHKVSWVVAAIFNAIAQEELVDLAILENPSKETRRQHIDQIRKWCTDRAVVTHADHLAKTVKEAKKWQDVKSAFWELLELDEGPAIKLIVARCESDPTHKPDLARLLCLLDQKEYLPRVREWMQDKDDATSFWSALLVLKHADKQNLEGLDIVLAGLANEIEGGGAVGRNYGLTPAGLLNAAIETLVAIDDPRVRKFFATYCGSKPYQDFDPSDHALQRLFLAGYEPALDRLFYYLGDTAPAYQGSKEPRSDSWLRSLSHWRYKNPPHDLFQLPDENRKEAYADLKRWLRAQFRLIKDGKPSEVIKEDLPLPWGDWRAYSSGWIKRI